MEDVSIRLLRAEEIECRIATINEKGLSLLLFKDARVDQKILDEVFGAFAWKRTHQSIDGNLYCTVEIFDKENQIWVAKQDVGTTGYTEKEKSQASDSFKRACFNWGIGRELYSAPFIWVSATKTEIRKNGDRYLCSDRFSVAHIEYNEEREIAGLAIRNDSKGIIVYELLPQNKKTKQPPEKMRTAAAQQVPNEQQRATAAAQSMSNEQQRATAVAQSMSNEQQKAATAARSMSNEQQREATTARSMSNEQQREATTARSMSNEQQRGATAAQPLQDKQTKAVEEAQPLSDEQLRTAAAAAKRSTVKAQKKAAVTKPQMDGLKAELERTGVTIEDVKDRYKIQNLEGMSEDLYKRVMTALSRTKSIVVA